MKKMLSGKRLMKTVDFVIAKYPELFEALEEYDKTHRLKKNQLQRKS